jgi:hypothetical protein
VFNTKLKKKIAQLSQLLAEAKSERDCHYRDYCAACRVCDEQRYEIDRQRQLLLKLGGKNA